MFIRGLLISAAFFLAVFVLPGPAFGGEEEHSLEPWEYKLGQGLRIGESSFHLGGYSSLNYMEHSGNDPGRVGIDDLSLFVFGEIADKLSFFSETEVTDLYYIDTDGDTSSDESFEIERLYLDYELAGAFTVRLGKFLTPVGTWNEVHADPLIWTVSRPLVSELTFPEHTTGLSVSGNFMDRSEELGFTIFVQNNESINEKTGVRRTHVMYGARIKWYATPRLTIAAPFLYYQEYHVGDDIYLSGLDLTYKTPKLEIRGEATVSRVDLSQGGGSSEEHGYYLQGVYSLTDKHYLVLRHEYLKARSSEGHHSSLSLGVVYKLRPQIVFKAEYQVRDGSLIVPGEGVDAGDRLLGSFSILF